jgi:hypothetical protein
MENTFEVLKSMCETLRENRYKEIQYIPARQSFFGLFKEFENLQNLFTKKKHLLFYYSIVPSFYLNRVSANYPNLKVLYKFCYLNQEIEKNIIIGLFGPSWYNLAIEANLILERNGFCQLQYSILPVFDYFIVRDSHNSYKYRELYEIELNNRVWVGSDSIKFVELNQKYLKNYKFKSTLELGSGTGIQLICLSNLSERMTGIDINPRAVEFTKTSTKLNNLENRIEVLFSDLFEKLNDKYDAIIANPWFIDIEKGGLEEIPDIVNKLDNYLLQNGVFVMFFSSYVKGNNDLAKKLLVEFAQEKGYEATFYGLGKTIEPQYLDRYKKLNISHINNYYAILNKTGKHKVTIHTPSVFRQIRDLIYLPLQAITKKPKYFFNFISRFKNI